MKIKLNIDTEKLQDKPVVFPGALRNRLCNEKSIREVTPEQFIDCVKVGLSFTPAVMTGTKADTWQSQQVVCADIDNDADSKENGQKVPLKVQLTPEHAREIMAKYGIDPYFMYYSFSNKPDWVKFRIVLILDRPLTDPKQATELKQRFTGIFNHEIDGCTDPTNKDNARLYYGGRSDSVFYTSGQITTIEQLEKLPKYEHVPERPEMPQNNAQKSTTNNSSSYTYERTDAQFEHDRDTFDLAGYVERTTTSQRVQRGSALFFNPCPICGHNDDFQVTGHLYHCHSASGGTGGTIIDYLMHHDRLTIAEAINKFKYEIMNYERVPSKATTPAPATDAAADRSQRNERLAVNTASTYLNTGTFENDIAYFREYRDRKLGIHPAIDRYLTLYPGLAILGGASSLGKTTFVVNLIDRLLDRGETVLYFSLEQLPIEIITKSLTRKVYEADPGTPLTNIDIKNGATDATVQRVKAEYAKHADHYDIITGNFRTTADDITQYVENYRREHNNCKPVVVIDYLQLIAPPDGFRGGIREYTDENLKTLKDMQKRNGLFVIAISSFNRSSNYEPISYESFKETSMIEFTCDYVWGLQLAILDAENDDFYTVTGAKGGRSERPIFDKRRMVNAEQEKMPKQVEFVSLKNRNGRQFFKAVFDYYQQYDTYIPHGSMAEIAPRSPWDNVPII